MVTSCSRVMLAFGLVPSDTPLAFAQFMPFSYQVAPPVDNFSDAASVSSYAVNAIQWAVANGIVNGSNGKLNPQNNATRAEVAAILMRFCQMSK